MSSSYMRVEKYYDVGCEECGFHLSTDFHRGLAETRIQAVKWAVKEGFQVVQGRTLCRKCAENVMYNKIE